MAAVGIAEAASRVVIFGEKESGEGAVGGVLAEKLIDRTQEALRLIDSDGALAAKIGLKIGHQESGGDALSGNVADDEAEAVAAEIEEIVIVTTDLAGLVTNPGVFEGLERREGSRKETRLNLFGDFEFLGCAAFGFELGSDRAALGFDGVRDFVEADEGKGVAVRVFETCKDAAPDRRVIGTRRGRIHEVRWTRMQFVLEALEARGELKLHAALAPFSEFGDDVFGDKSDVSRMADEFVCFGVWLGGHEREIGSAVGRSDGDPAAARLNAGVENEVETKLVKVEREAALQVADVDSKGLKAKVGVLAVEANRGIVCPLGGRAGHGQTLYDFGKLKVSDAAKNGGARREEQHLGKESLN